MNNLDSQSINSDARISVLIDSRKEPEINPSGGGHGISF